MADAPDQVRQEIRRLARLPGKVRPSRTAKWDMMAHSLTTEDVCDVIIDWIDAGERVKETVLHSVRGRRGEPAFEMKPRVNNVLFYLKVAFDCPGKPGESLLLLSVHPDHS